MPNKNNKQLELFKNEIEQAWDERHELGRLYYEVYNNLKFFVYDMTDVSNKLKPVVKREIKINNQNVILKLRPETISDDTEVKTRYLGELEQNIFDFILYKLSQDSYTMINQKYYVVISMSEIRNKLKYDLKRIRQSLYLLAKYTIEYETKDFEGSIPNQLVEEIIIGKTGRTNNTLVRLSNGLMNYVFENKYLLMNYEDMFKLDRIGKILFKRICISNYMELGETQKQKFVMNESICNLLAKYSIEYKNRLQKSRLFKEIYNSLELMKQKNIIGHYETKDIKVNRVITDFKLTLYLTKEFSNRFSAYQLNKNRLEREQAEKHIMKMKQKFIGDNRTTKKV